MDSYNFQFERMSNIDLHPLSLPMSRLSPAKSNSSIADQFVHHHQHGKGDSAYSSFSGGSTVPDYPSPFLPDDLHSNSFSHYADLKYVKSLYNPAQVLQSDPKTMDQLYRSVEAISQQYRHSNSNLNHYNGSESAYTNNRTVSKQDTASQAGFITHSPPPIPTRLDSFIATKNLENTRAHHGSQQLQSPRQQCEKSNVKTEAYRRASQPPSYHLQHLANNQTITQTNPEYFAINNNKLEQSKIGKNLSQSPPKGANQMEHLKQKQSQNTQIDPQVINNRNSLENHRRRAHSTNDFVGSDSQREYRSWSIGQSVVNSSIQHKGQFYFVTGVCKTAPDSETRQHATSLCGSESGHELETYKLRERCHSTMENLFRPLQPSPCLSTSDDRSFVSASKPNSVVNMCEENLRQSLSKSSRSLEALEEIDVTQSRDIGRHTPNNPIFYCGPERASPSQQTKEVAGLSNEQLKHVREEQGKRVNRQSLGDVASERINKETTPLLYQLTGASRAGFKTEAKTGALDIISEPASNNTAIDAACNTLDHSYKKFYREQLKDVQSRVLRETSFKRRDLQLSRPHRVRERSDPKPAQPVQEARPTAVHQFTPSQDSETSTETLTPSVTSEDTEKGSVREAVDVEIPKQAEKESEKENGRHANVAQPQVPRIGGRKRLTPEQKKMCFSEPEKLHQIGRGAVSHSSCRSFGNESENVFNMEQEADDGVLQTGPGFVAARRKVFESRGRALSASSASKTNLKHLQHKALVEYMERKTGQKVAEPQQPAPQTPAATRQRHSLGEKPFDWGHRLQSGPQESKKKRLNRPHSAGRILDSSTSSIRYAQFFSNQSSSGQSCGQLYQPKLRQSRGPSQGKSASVEDLLDQPENHSFYRNRSTSSPHPFQAFEAEADPLLVNDTKETASSHEVVPEDSGLKAEGQQPVRVVAQRGKSMEELGTAKFTRPKALSKSTEQLDSLCRHSSPAEPELQKKTTSKSLEMVKNADLQQEQQQQTITQAPPNQPRRKSPVKQNSEPILGGKDEDDDDDLHPNTSSSPGSCSSARTRIHSQGALPNQAWSGTSPAESPRGQGEPKSCSPAQTKSGSEKNRPSPRTRSSASEIEESVDNSSNADLPPPPPLDPNQEVSLSCGVTTDPALWPPPPPPAEEQLTQDVPDPSLTETISSEASVCTPPTETSSTVSPSTSLSDLELTAQVNEEKTPQSDDTNLDQQNPDLEERGTPEGETEVQEAPAEKPQWEELVVAVVKADQSLARALYPLADRKTALMLMEQLLSEDTLLMEEHYKKKQEQRESVEVVEITEAFTCPSSQSLDAQNKADVKEKKRLLVSYIEERLLSLADARASLQTEVEENRSCGEELQALVRERCSPVELERYNLFMGDLERVVSLLLCLSSRLARVQNALSTVDQHTDAEEKESLDSRHRLLCKQRDDAKDLKDNLDRRESQVSAFLSRQLSPEQLRSYKRFVQTKASLLIRQKDLEERQRLGEEQLEALELCLK